MRVRSSLQWPRASQVEPEVAGKPYGADGRPRTRPAPDLSLVVGDRPATDGLFAKRLGVPFALVHSGVTPAGPREARTGSPTSRQTTFPPSWTWCSGYVGSYRCTVNQLDGLRRYIEAATTLTQITRGRAEELVRDLVASGELERNRAQDWIEDLVKRSREASETLVARSAPRWTANSETGAQGPRPRRPRSTGGRRSSAWQEPSGATVTSPRVGPGTATGAPAAQRHGQEGFSDKASGKESNGRVVFRQVGSAKKKARSAGRTSGTRGSLQDRAAKSAAAKKSAGSKTRLPQAADRINTSRGRHLSTAGIATPARPGAGGAADWQRAATRRRNCRTRKSPRLGGSRRQVFETRGAVPSQW